MQAALKKGLDRRLSGQLLSAVGSINATFAEGFSRSTLADRLRFLDYSLGSARESISWYRISADAIPADTLSDRYALIARIRSLLLGTIRSIRAKSKRPTKFEP